MEVVSEKRSYVTPDSMWIYMKALEKNYYMFIEGI